MEARRVESSNALGSDTKTRTGYIETVGVMANFSGTPRSGGLPLTVSFTDLSTNSPTSWSWDFGDGGTSSLQNPTHVYTSVGAFTVSLTTSNPFSSDGETKLGYIQALGVRAGFSGSPRSGAAPLSVSFTDQSTNGPTSWSWDFGDGGSSSLQHPTHDYSSPGTFKTGLLTNTGSAYVFERSGTSWLQTAKLVGVGIGPNGRFGASVALSGDTAVVGASAVIS